MSSIEKLIYKYCPNGVEYKKLQDIGEFHSGLTGKKKDDFIDGNAKFITYMNCYKNPALKIDVEDKVKINNGERQNTLEYGDVIFTGSSENLEEAGLTSVLTIKTYEKLYLNSFCFIFRFNDKDLFLPDFSKHLFRSDYIRKQIKRCVSGVTRFNLSKTKLASVQLPVPPLEVQREIVEILDNLILFSTNLSTKLSAELIARKEQFSVYIKKMMTFNNADYHKLLDICKVLRGKRLTSRDLVENGKYNIYHGGLEPLGKYDKYNRKKDTVMIINVGASAGFVGYSNEEFWSSDGCYCLEHSNEYISKFLYYYFLTKQNELISKVRKAGIPTLDYSVIERMNVPIVSLQEQQHIVEILDRYVFLYNNITFDLSSEIEARQKRYEYYRDKLLTFKRLEA